MHRRKCLILCLVSLFSWLIAVGCSPRLATTNVGVGGTVTITVSAAASLQDALDAIAPQFIQTYPDIVIDYNFASSGALQRQIEQGATADIFFSAAAQQMEALSDKDLISSESRQDIVANRLVLIAPSRSTLTITEIAQLKDADISRFSVGEFRSVPAGQYAEQVFDKLGLLESFRSKFIFGNNVRSVLAAVESGNVDVGIVYATDAVLSNQVQVLATVPAEFHPSIVYPIAIVQNTAHPQAAQTFINFLTTDTAQAIFQEFGFDSI